MTKLLKFGLGLVVFANSCFVVASTIVKPFPYDLLQSDTTILLDADTTYTLEKPIEMPSRCTLKGQGDGLSKTKLIAGKDFVATYEPIHKLDLAFIMPVRQAELKNITIENLELDGSQDELGIIAYSDFLKRINCGINTRGKTWVIGQPDLRDSVFIIKNCDIHDVNVQCIGISDCTEIQILNSHLYNVGHPDFIFQGKTLSEWHLNNGGPAWYWNYMHGVYLTRCQHVFLTNCVFDTLEWGSGIDLTGCHNVTMSGCSFENVKQSAFYLGGTGVYGNGGIPIECKDIDFNHFACENIGVVGMLNSGVNVYLKNGIANNCQFAVSVNGSNDIKIWDNTFTDIKQAFINHRHGNIFSIFRNNVLGIQSKVIWERGGDYNLPPVLPSEKAYGILIADSLFRFTSSGQAVFGLGHVGTDLSKFAPFNQARFANNRVENARSDFKLFNDEKILKDPRGDFKFDGNKIV
ncbi:MAG: hypothetical protein UR26_C0002G0211 [candidate division TM6 bacterium GW2011_GWF2_32_72]|nr:MAG: hypothetical protein UR26_C0002G0211 [candidate division TM6 bacterium GW2011_GWF2_32_72]